MESDKEVQKLTDFETKKSIHVSMSKTAHTEFRKKLFDFDLSMQEVLELFAILAGENDERVIDIMKQARNLKRSKTLQKLTDNEVENLYDTISQIDPFRGQRDTSQNQ